MFNTGDIVCVLLPIAVGDGYDYRLTAPADVGTFVRVRVQNRPYIGVIIGPGHSALPPEKIKDIEMIVTGGLSHPACGGGGAGIAPGGEVHSGINRATKQAQSFAKTLRHKMTMYECLLWKKLRKSPGGFDFIKQFPIGPYIVDFVNRKTKLIIELDGRRHAVDEQIRHDAMRDKFLTESGYRIIRFWNRQVYSEMQNVLDIIYYLLTHDDIPELRDFYPIDFLSPTTSAGLNAPPVAGGTATPPPQAGWDNHLSESDIRWIYKMADWTMMPPGAVLKLILNIPDAFDPPKTEQTYTFSAPAKIRMTPARQAVADAFTENEGEPMTAADISQIAHVSDVVVRTMIKNGTLVPAGERAKTKQSDTKNEYFDTGKVHLTDEQQSAADAIDTTKFNVHVLDGITGSGKTQVYFDTAMRVYLSGKSVLLMMPEIALTAQFRARFTDRFGAPPVIWHSAITAARRREIWRGVAMGDVRIVVGTRSALFLPWQNLGLIVVDEEHDPSYKQEDMGVYNARDMAILRGSIQNFPVVLASATPSMETMKNVAAGNYNISHLSSRFGGASMPTIQLVDMRNEKRETRGLSHPACGGGGAGIAPGGAVPPRLRGDATPALYSISSTLADAITETLQNHHQVMLFLNRRGFAPVVQCTDCGWVATCPDCSIGMTLHKPKNGTGKLLCHMCGRTMPMPIKCPECGGENIRTTGTGIEKIEEEVHARWPNARTAIVSSDTIGSRQSLERIVTKMESGEIDIVIGTQILAKGHHFPNLTLVGVIDADAGLFGADFRSSEKTFAQLFQVSGRAGRGDAPGRVLLQTYQTVNPVMRALVANDRDAAMAADTLARRAAHMPPFGQLIAIIVESKNEKTLKMFCDKLLSAAPRANGVRIMGPIPAPIYQIRNWYRNRFLVMGAEKMKLQSVVGAWMKKINAPANVRVKIDVGPISFN